ncbi:protein FAM83G isoform X1 [Phascolarctos cinereus]|uniref:Protein FAM83G isoform X1 n=1 Tax=Phascolarctos cinereus TaxID=38626 RepID=A0A6P5LV72_PHACI|nr:protein FAM83G isoform X1 [Phascolarctos cinereus]
MAYSQVQCLDDSHVNWRSSESKPEFFYSEGQRLALEALVARGPEAFYEVLKKENIRDFLSELELKKILETIEVYDPGSEDPREQRGLCEGSGPHDKEENGEGGGDADGDADLVPSLEYWPQKSDRSIPQLDLGWPDTIAYRGVTRASVYMQPPIDGQAHIKEVVRKMINQAQKVIAVVMDMFTDVDIFKDLLDAGFKRKVAVYIIVDEANVKYFLHMCERAQMHTGHLKNLRVRSIGGTEFFTRSATKFKGALAQKFMFVDGDRAMCGSYSFTWSAARTDRNVISVLSGQVVEMFDKQFQELYLMSQGVSLKTVPMEKEPEPEPIILPTVIPLAPSGTVAKKLINPKYALVKAKSADEIAKASSEKQESGLGKKFDGKGKVLVGNQLAEQPGDFLEQPLPIHPGLLNMERANMFDYLPTWVEPDPEPGSDILGYINIIDPNVWNPQPSQMNRIKICDSSSQAVAQYKLLQRRQSQEVVGPVVASPPDPPAAVEETKDPPVSPQEELSPKDVPTTVGKDRDQGVFVTLAENCHLQDGHDQEDTEIKPPVPKPRTVHVTDFLTKGNSYDGGLGCQPGGPKEEESLQPEGPSNGTTYRPHENSGHHKLLRQLSMSQEGQDPPSPGTPNGLNIEEDEDDDDDYVTLSDQDSFSGGSTNSHHRQSTASSVSDEYFEVRDNFAQLRRRHSEHIPNGAGHIRPLYRKLSEPHMSRGTFMSPLRSPQWLQSSGVEDEYGRKRNNGKEEVKHMLGRGPQRDSNKACASPATQGQQFYRYGDKRPASGTRDKGSFQQSAKNPELPKYRRDGIHAADGFQHPAKKSGPATVGSRYWQTKGGPPDSRNLRTARTPGSPAESGSREELSTPFGIPLSKLSQNKILRNRAGGGLWASADSRRRAPGPTSHKD